MNNNQNKDSHQGSRGIGAAVTKGAQMSGAAAASFGSAVGAAIPLGEQELVLQPGAVPVFDGPYWHSVYPSRNYYSPEIDFTAIAPAYQLGWESRFLYPDKTWDSVEHLLVAAWRENSTDTSLPWDHVKSAVADAWYEAAKRSGLSDETKVDPP